MGFKEYPDSNSWAYGDYFWVDYGENAVSNKWSVDGNRVAPDEFFRKFIEAVKHELKAGAYIGWPE